MKNTIFVMLISLLVINFAYAVREPGTANSINNFTPSNLNSRSLDPIVNEIGYISWSIDGIGINQYESIGTIQVDKPVGATVRSAHFYTATVGWHSYELVPGDVKIDGVDVVWDQSLPASIPCFNYYADITSMVSAKLDSAAPGLVDFEITELNSADIDGDILAVIFDDPNQTEDVTIAFMFGAQNITGDQFNIGLSEPIEPDTEVYMSLGISYGYQPNTGQVSHIDVNGQRLTSSAGGQDDAVIFHDTNGALITVGGLDDSYDNPVDPYAGDIDLRYDDELYTLTPLLNLGDTQITVDTINPSIDDNIFFAAFNISGAAVVGEGCVLTPTFATRFVGENHTVTATLQDDLGNPVVGRYITIEVTSGPHMGTMDYVMTDALGKVYFTYSGSLVGMDIIEASFLNDAGMLQWAENIAEVVWERQVPVTLSSFTAVYNNTPTLNWTTQSESNNLGWNIYRSATESLELSNQINDLLIPGNGTTTEPTQYVYNDLSNVESNTTYWYWLESTSYNGETEFHGPVTLTIQDDESQLPDLPTASVLHNNYPNPFNPSTMINFSINQGETGSLTILNSKGQVMETRSYDAGAHQFNWDATNYSSGIYFYKLETQTYSNIKKMIMVK